MVAVVTFHTETWLWKDDAHPLGGRRQPNSHLLPLFLSSVRKYGGEVEVYLITTPKEASLGSDFDHTVCAEIDHQKLMLERLRLQHEVLESISGPVAFLDTDVLILRPLSEVFEINFDVAVTVRDQPKHEFERAMPYNNGVWFCRGDNRPGELEYLQDLFAMNVAMNSERHAWSGNQYAVRDILGRRRPGETFTMGKLKFAALPCSHYNYAPNRPGERTEGRSILHFRGEAKPLMTGYAKELL